MWIRSNCLCVYNSLQVCRNYGRVSFTSPSTVVRAFHSMHSKSQWRLHHPLKLKHRTTQPFNHRTVRWYNQGGGTNGGKGGGTNGGKESGKTNGGKEGGKTNGGDGGNFFQKFFVNIRKELKGGEVQESLKGFNEEREEMQQSYVIQQAKLKLGAMIERAKDMLFKSSEKTSTGWSIVKSTSSKAYKEAADTDIAKKGHAIGSQIAKDVHKTAEIVSKTDVGQVVRKGSEVVKEDLLDDIIKESSPYKAPEKIMTRSDLASDFAKPKTYSPDDDTKGVVVTRQSKWKQQWKEWKENNPISNSLYGIKTRYDESDNIVIRASRVVTDKVGDVVGGAMTQSDMAEALAQIHKIDPTFNKEEFVQQCKYEIIPSVLEAFMQGNEPVLKDWCHEAAFGVLSTVMKQRQEPGVKLRCKVLEVKDIDVLMARVLEQGPVLILGFRAQQLTRKTPAKGDGIEEEILEDVMYIWALCRDQAIYDPKTAWRVIEFGIQSAGKMLV